MVVEVSDAFVAAAAVLGIASHAALADEAVVVLDDAVASVELDILSDKRVLRKISCRKKNYLDVLKTDLDFFVFWVGKCRSKGFKLTVSPDVIINHE